MKIILMIGFFLSISIAASLGLMLGVMLTTRNNNYLLEREKEDEFRN